MYDVITVCHYIAYYCFIKSYELTNIRLQKILYFLQVIFLDMFDNPLFHDKIEAWDLGPTIPKAYDYYRKKYGVQFIPWGVTDDINEIKDDDKKVIAFTISALSRYSTFQLIKITQEQKPWKDNYISYDNHEIPLSSIKEFINEIKCRE